MFCIKRKNRRNNHPIEVIYAGLCWISLKTVATPTLHKPRYIAWNYRSQLYPLGSAWNTA